MAQLKQLSAGSSQIIMMMFRDKNNAEKPHKTK